MIHPYLQDLSFLQQLDYHHNKTINVRITLLGLDNEPREQIEGVATGGSINIDGASAVRRSCSLTISAAAAMEQNLPIITDANWCYDNQFKLEVGLNNNIEPKYPDIIWFDMGIYLITSFSKSRSTNAYNISISGKDKMARLNGDISGYIMAGTDFGTEEIVEKVENNKGELEYQITITKLTIPTIIRNAIKVYGQERDENIIINDLEDTAFELWEYRGDKPMYLILLFETGQQYPKVINMTFTQPEISKDFKFYSFNTLDKDYNNDASSFPYGGKNCYLAKIEYGQTAGYHQTKLVYNSDLILNAGETVTSMLDKIKTMLGDFEYFYDLQGHFIFQKKKTYIQELFSPVNGEVVTPIILTSPYSYKFENEELFTAISNNPQINNIKNDFAVWCSRKGVGGADIPIHARCGIQKKPTSYISPWQGNKEYNIQNYDYRELIYQMAIDFYAHGQDTDFLIQLSQYNPQFINGKTGYEQYYIDIQAFWRQIYDPQPDDWAIEQYGEFYNSAGSDGEGKDKYWNKKLHTDPNSLNFWFDLYDTTGEISKYNIEKIGVRSKVVNENSIKSIYFREIPEVQFIVSGKDEYKKDVAYSPIWIQENMEQMFQRSGQSASAIDKINELVRQHTLINEAITISSIPVYYLQPNTRIYVAGQGDCTLDKISYSLAYNGTMSLTCNKIFKTI